MGNETSSTPKDVIEEQRCRYINLTVEQVTDITDDLEPVPDEPEPEEEEDVSSINPREYYFPFENLVFEGGGAKGWAYVGVIQCLEEEGILKNITRIGGVSAGSFIAVLVALGYTTTEIKTFIDVQMDELLCDGGLCTLLPNLFRQFGWFQGLGFERWLGNVIAKKTGSAYTTFEEILRMFGRELCIVVTNVNLMRPEYCHPKTTPDLPVLHAVRMSMAVPGVFVPQKRTLHGTTDVFVDGGLTCNYPIHCFDGWYLSMAKEDNFFQRLHGTLDHDIHEVFEDRFLEEPTNLKTLGFILNDDNERELYQHFLQKRVLKDIPAKPEKETKLYKKWAKKHDDAKKAGVVHENIVEAGKAFFKVLKKHNLDEDNVIDRQELENALSDDIFTPEHAKLLFGQEKNMDVLNILDHNKNGKICFNELMVFLENAGLSLQRFFGYSRLDDIDTFTRYVLGIHDTIILNLKRVHFKKQDVKRSVIINTGYVSSDDFKMENEDKEFIADRGYNSCLSFLQHFVKENKLKKGEGESKLEKEEAEKTLEKEEGEKTLEKEEEENKLKE